VLFTAALAGKLRAYQFSEFVLSLRRFSIPKWLRKAVARGVIVAEGALVVALLVPMATRVAGLAAAGLLSVFTVALIGRLRRGDRAPCHCFGSSGHPLGVSNIIRNCAGIACSLLTAADAGWPGWPVAVPLLAAGAACGAVLVLADAIGALFAAPKELDRT